MIKNRVHSITNITHRSHSSKLFQPKHKSVAVGADVSNNKTASAQLEVKVSAMLRTARKGCSIARPSFNRSSSYSCRLHDMFSPFEYLDAVCPTDWRPFRCQLLWNASLKVRPSFITMIPHIKSWPTVEKSAECRYTFHKKIFLAICAL